MASRVLYLVVCAAPPARAVSEPIGVLQAKGWTVCVIATPRATGWIDSAALAEQTGYPVRDEYTGPEDPESLPRADAIAVAPATFNTVNKWVAGISDTFALGLLNEAIGLRLPIVVAPYAKSSLAAHPAYARSLQTLSEWGVMVLPNEVIRVGVARDVFDWRPLVDAMDGV
jgi:phosphopantothenoylcysteine decarboxylase